MTPPNLNHLQCLDLYLMALSEKEYRALRHKIKPLAHTPHPLLSTDLRYLMPQQPGEQVRVSDLKTLRGFQKKYDWLIDPAKFLITPYEAIVVTDTKLVIEWVSPGFTRMTGYTASEVTGKTPKLLQGIHTSEATRQKIREHLHKQQPFTETLINYRKNKEEYLCRISVLPMHNTHNQLTHFLALESEVA